MKVQTQPAEAVVPKRGAGTRDQVARQVAGMDSIEVKATIPDAQIEKALLRYNLTVDNDEERYISGERFHLSCPVPAGTRHQPWRRSGAAIEGLLP